MREWQEFTGPQFNTHQLGPREAYKKRDESWCQYYAALWEREERVAVEPLPREGYYEGQWSWYIPEQKCPPYETSVCTMEQPMGVLVGKLRSKFKRGDYSLLLSEDRGGRLPTLAMMEVANYFSDINGLPRPAVRFVQAGRMISNERVSSQIDHIFNQKFFNPNKEKALVITEYILSGIRIARLSSLLSTKGITFDLATLAMNKPEDYYRHQNIFPPHALVFYAEVDGHKGSKGPATCHTPALSGLLPQRRERGERQVEVGRALLYRAMIAAGRRDIKRLTQNLIANL